jgi:UDP-N-acetylglucosamine 4,6-dehydratase
MLDGKSILVTGGTGSFGRAFIKTVLDRYAPSRLIVFSRDELKQYEMQQDPAFGSESPMRYFIGDVRDQSRLELAMRGVDYVIHAAALKHVPAAEYNPFECIHTNVMGAENVVNASLRTGVEKVVALSTDKAANPVNLYGASKLAADKIFVAGNNLSGENGAKYSVVRYGNVIGSRGSVVPLFQRLAREGVKKIPITDDRMTRFWITLAQGVDFVLQSLERTQGGEIFVPKIPSMKIVDLAATIVPDAVIEIVGIRPGEKLHEVMITEDDARSTLEFDSYFLIQPAFAYWESRSDVNRAAGSPVPDGFRYSSESNTEWMTPDELRKIVGGSSSL